MMLPRKQQIQEQLYDMAELSMIQIAETIVDLNIQHALAREKLQELEQEHEALTELQQEHQDLNADYQALQRSAAAMATEVELLRDQLAQLKALIHLTNYQKESV